MRLGTLPVTNLALSQVSNKTCPLNYRNSNSIVNLTFIWLAGKIYRSMRHFDYYSVCSLVHTIRCLNVAFKNFNNSKSRQIFLIDNLNNFVKFYDDWISNRGNNLLQYVRYRDFYHLPRQTAIFHISAINLDFSKFPQKNTFLTF